MASPNKQNPDSGIETASMARCASWRMIVQTNRIPTQGLKPPDRDGVGGQDLVQTNRIPTQGLKLWTATVADPFIGGPNKQNPDSGIETLHLGNY